MKSFTQLITEAGLQPNLRANDEKAFKAAHVVQRTDYPVGDDSQFAPGMKTPPRRADNAFGLDKLSYASMPGQNPVEQPTINPTTKVVKTIDADDDEDGSDSVYEQIVSSIKSKVMSEASQKSMKHIAINPFIIMDPEENDDETTGDNAGYGISPDATPAQKSLNPYNVFAESYFVESGDNDLHMFHSMSKDGDTHYFATHYDLKGTKPNPVFLGKIRDENPVYKALRDKGYANHTTHAIWQGPADKEVERAQGNLDKNQTLSPLSREQEQKRINAIKQYSTLNRTDALTDEARARAISEEVKPSTKEEEESYLKHRDAVITQAEKQEKK